MKKYLFVILMLISFIRVNGQSIQYKIKNNFAGYGTISGITAYGSGDSIFNFTVNSFFGNIRSRGEDNFSMSDLLVDDLLFSTECNVFQIKEIVSNNGFTITGRMRNLDLEQTSKPTNYSVVAILREREANNKFKTFSMPPASDGNGGAISGIDLQTYNCILGHYRIMDSIAFQGLNILPLNNTFTGKNRNTDTLFLDKGLVSLAEISSVGVSTKGTTTKPAYTINGIKASKDTVITTNNFTINGSYEEWGVDCSSGSKTVILPANSTSINWVAVIFKADSSTNTLTIKDSNNNDLYSTNSRLVITFKNNNSTWKKSSVSTSNK